MYVLTALDSALLKVRSMRKDHTNYMHPLRVCLELRKYECNHLIIILAFFIGIKQR